MDVFLVQSDAHPWFAFTVEPTQAAAAGLRGWIGRVHHRFQDAIAAHVIAPDRPLGRLLSWLRTRIHPDESLFRHLRTAHRVVLHHSPRVAADDAQAAWAEFLGRGRKRHRFWLALDALLSPLTIPLMFLPGPNVVGYWVVFRAICHWLAWRGAARAARGGISLDICNDENLQSLPGETRDDVVERILRGAAGPHAHELIHAAEPPHDDLDVAQPGADRSSPEPRFFHAGATVPVLLSAARLAMGLGFPWAPRSWRTGLIVAAAASDALDGLYCRVFRATSVAGQMLDPLADKVVLIAVIAAFVVEGDVGIVPALLVGFREIAVLIGSVTVAITRGRSYLKQMPPRLLGKLTTAAQFAWIIALAAYPAAARQLVAPTAILSIAAGLDYVYNSPAARRVEPQPR